MTKNETLAIINTLATIVEGKAIDYTGTTKEKMEHDIQALLPKVVEVVQVLQAQKEEREKALWTAGCKVFDPESLDGMTNEEILDTLVLEIENLRGLLHKEDNIESGMPGVDQSDEEEDNDLVCLGWFCSELKIKQVSSLWQQVRCRDRSREMQDDVAVWFEKGFYNRNKKECGDFFTLLRKIAEDKGWKVTAHLTFMQFSRGGK